jgi:hypothetical protein
MKINIFLTKNHLYLRVRSLKSCFTNEYFEETHKNAINYTTSSFYVYELIVCFTSCEGIMVDNVSRFTFLELLYWLDFMPYILYLYLWEVVRGKQLVPNICRLFKILLNWSPRNMILGSKETFVIRGDFACDPSSPYSKWEKEMNSVITIGVQNLSLKFLCLLVLARAKSSNT